MARLRENPDPLTLAKDRSLLLASIEAEVRRAQLATGEVGKLKHEFQCAITHELLTPLNCILGAADALAADPDLSAGQRQLLSIVEKSGTSLHRMICNILEYTRLEAGAIAWEPAEFSLAELLAVLAGIYSAEAERKGLAFSVAAVPSPDLRLLADTRLLQRLLAILLENAVKFTDHGAVSMAAQVLDRGDRMAKIRFTVQDTGAGLSSAQQERLFEEFSQVDQSNTRRHGGIGLGLSICRRLVLLAGGEIGFESNAGHGSSFHVALNLGLAPVQPSPTPRQERSQTP